MKDNSKEGRIPKNVVIFLIVVLITLILGYALTFFLGVSDVEGHIREKARKLEVRLEERGKGERLYLTISSAYVPVPGIVVITHGGSISGAGGSYRDVYLWYMSGFLLLKRETLLIT